MPDTVLVTGASGFIAGHCILQLLAKGYNVRGTLRNLERSNSVRATLRRHLDFEDSLLSFVQANLTQDDGWDEAASGCAFVVHMASPVGAIQPKDENDYIVPAVDGTKRVLRAASRAGVKKVVLTSSIAAVGPAEGREEYTEDDWFDVQSPAATPYKKAKTLAEKAAWEFVRTESTGMALTTILPAFVLGPCLEEDYGPSLLVIKRLLDKSMRAIPRLGFSIVDVRSVAELHVLALENSAADGQRFIASNGTFTWTSEVVQTLNSSVAFCRQRPAPTFVAPYVAIWLLSFFDAQVRSILPTIGVVSRYSSNKAKTVLGWKPRTEEEAIVSAAESLIEYGVVS